MSKYCTSCGAELMEGARFCIKCGANIKISLSTTIQQQNYQKIFYSRNINQIIIAIMAVIIVIIIIVAILLIFFPGSIL